MNRKSLLRPVAVWHGTVVVLVSSLALSSAAMGQRDPGIKKDPGPPVRSPVTLQRVGDFVSGESLNARCIDLAAVEHNASRRPGSEPRFSAAEVIDARFRLRVTQQGLSDSVARFRFYTPNGHLYEQIDVPFAKNPGERAERRLPGYPHPVAVARAEEQRINDDSFFDVPVALPVGGTLISTNSLYGLWMVEAYLGGGDSPCAKAVEFYILE